MTPEASSSTEQIQICGRWPVQRPPTPSSLRTSQTENPANETSSAPPPSQATEKEGNLVDLARKGIGGYSNISERQAKLGIEDKKAEINVVWLKDQLPKLLECYSKMFPDPFQRWQQRIRTILDRYNDWPLTTVALYGETGSGKSSIIQALCQKKDIVKANSVRAGTQYITTIGYNYRDPQAWRAEVHTISIDQWKADVKLLMRDIKFQHDNDEDGETAGLAYGDTIGEGLELTTNQKYAIKKIRNVYRNLEAENLQHMSVDEVMSQLDLSDTLGRIHEFEGRKLTKLEKAMKDPFGSGTDLTTSPLVSIVKIFGPLQFLQKGLQLADIPGVGDAYGARGRIAEKYQKHVDAFWIVNPIQRAVDSQTLWDNFGMAWRQMELRQIQEPAEHITFVLSKCDEIDVVQSLKTADPDKNLMNMIKWYERLETEILRRHPPDCHRRLKDSMNEAFEQLSIKAVSRRNQICTDEIQQCVATFRENRRRKHASQSEQSSSTLAEKKTCPVFCVSSQAFEQLGGFSGKETGATVHGFPTKPGTQIPQLINHCSLASLHARAEHVRQFCESVTSFEDEMRSWALDKSPERAITAQQMTTLETNFEVVLRDLENSVEQEIGKTFGQLSQYALWNLERRLRGAAMHAPKKVEGVVHSWFKDNSKNEIPWNTLRGCASRQGAPMRSRSRKLGNKLSLGNKSSLIHLNELLAKPWTEHTSQGWNDYRKSIEDQRDSHTKNLGVQIVWLFETITKLIKETCGFSGIPSWTSSRKMSLQQSFNNLIHDLIKHYDACIGKLQDVERRARHITWEHMLPVYDTCAELSGSGVRDKLKQVLTSHIAKTSQTMCDAASEQILGWQRKNLTKLKQATKTRTEQYLVEIRQVLKDMLKFSYENETVTFDNPHSQKVIVQKSILRSLWDQDVKRRSETKDTSSLDCLAETAIFQQLEENAAAHQESEDEDDEDDDVQFDVGLVNPFTGGYMSFSEYFAAARN